MSAPPLDRGLFDLSPDVVWALHCAEGPVPRPSVAAARAFLEKELRPWELGADAWRRPMDEARREAALLLGGEPADYTLTGSTSAGLACVAQAYPWRAGDEVLAPLGEFPSNAWPWKALEARRVSFREVPLWDGHLAGRRALDSAPPAAGRDPEARLLAALGPLTRILTVSWVRFQDGLRLDLGRLARGCQERGVALVVDGIQGAGVLTPPLAGVSAFATGVHKGLLSPQGAGLLWTAPEFRARLSPLGSWLSVEEGGDFRRPSTDLERGWLPDGRRFEQGGMGGLCLLPLASSLALLREAGTERIGAHVDALQARLLDQLAGTSWKGEAARLTALRQGGHLGPILGLFHGGRGAAAMAEQVKAGFARGIFTSVREGYLRLALHGWHTEADVDRLAGWLAAD